MKGKIWIILAIYLIVIALIVYNSFSQNLKGWQLIYTFVPQVIVASLLFAVAVKKTGRPIK
ncbi:MAG: hypothetical protein V1846_00875 [Candidatus Komeilibacteria bacterium]